MSLQSIIQQIKTANTPGENTALRVGTAFEQMDTAKRDIIDSLSKSETIDMVNSVKLLAATGTPFLGTIKPSSTIPAGNFWAFASEGTYANAGGIVVGSGEIAIITRVGSTFDSVILDAPVKSIEDVQKTSTVGLVDTYTITYTDGSTPTTFEVTNGETITDWTAKTYLQKSTVIKDNSIWRVADGQTANVGDVPGISAKWVSLGSRNLRIYEDLPNGTILNEKEQVIYNDVQYIVLQQAIVGTDLPTGVNFKSMGVNNITNINQEFNIDPSQIVPSEALYTDETLAGDIVQRVDLEHGISENFKEVFDFIDGSPISDSDVDELNYLKVDDRYFKKLDFNDKNINSYTTIGQEKILPISQVEINQKLILTVSISSLTSGNLRLVFDNNFVNISISSTDTVSDVLTKIQSAIWFLNKTIVSNTIEITKNTTGIFRFFIDEIVAGLTITSSEINTELLTTTVKLFSQNFDKINYTYIIDYDFDLQGQKLEIPANCVINLRGGSIKNGEIKGNNTLILIDQDRDVFENVYFTGTFKKSQQLFQYDNLQILKNNFSNSLFPGKSVLTHGFHFKDDGGGAFYTVDTDVNFSNEYEFFQSFYNGSTINGMFVNLKYSSFGTKSTLYAKLTRLSGSLNVAHFGVKYDATYYDSASRKWYSDQSFTNLATDNYEAFSKIQTQLKYFAASKMPRTIYITDVLVCNQTVKFTSGIASMKIAGDGFVYSPDTLTYPNIPLITSNADLDVLWECLAPGIDLIVENIAFFGCDKRIKNGLLYRNGGEVEGLRNIVASWFENAGIVWLGLSSSFKLDIVSLFHNRVGLLITNKNPTNPSDIYVTSDRIMSANRISGAFNSSALIEIDEGNSVYPSVLQLRDIKNEGFGDSTIKIISGHIGTNIKIDGIVSYPDQDPSDVAINNLIIIEDSVVSVPTIEMCNWILIKNGTNFEIVDNKNNKTIDFPLGFTSNPHLIYKGADESAINGFMVFEDGQQIGNFGTNKKSGSTAQRPSITGVGLELKFNVGLEYFDTTLGKPIWIKEIISNVITWVDSSGSVV